jgi:hypothetical protein
MSHIKVYCLMSAGGPITQQVNDVLLLNAIDMWDQRLVRQPIRARSYEGIIETDLEVIDFQDVPVVQFEAKVTIRDVPMVTGVTEVRYLLRVDDLDGIEIGEWGRLQARVMGDPDMPMPFPPPLPPAPFPWIIPGPEEDDDE